MSLEKEVSDSRSSQVGGGSKALGLGQTPGPVHSRLAASPPLAFPPRLQSWEAGCVLTPSLPHSHRVPICLAGGQCWDISQLPSIMSQ